MATNNSYCIRHGQSGFRLETGDVLCNECRKIIGLNNYNELLKSGFRYTMWDELVRRECRDEEYNYERLSLNSFSPLDS